MRGSILDLAEFEVWLAEFRDLHRAGGPGSGRFARTARGKLDGLASADFAVIDYTLGPWPPPPSDREARVKVLQGFQATRGGLFGADAAPDGPAGSDDGLAGPDDEPFCRSGYFVAALELLGARPLHPIRAMDRLRSPPGMAEFLDGIDWSSPGPDPRRAAAVASSFAITGDVGPEWFERFFARLDREVDPKSGCWGRSPGTRDARALRAAFEIMAVHERFRAPLGHAGAAVRTALSLQRADGLYDESGPGWTELAAAYVLDRGFRHSGEGRSDVLAACERLLRAVAERLADGVYRSGLASSPHRAAGAVSALAVLSTVLPGSVRSRRPLRLYTERHLFV